MQTIMGARSAVLRLGDPEGGDAAQVGGKAAQLSRLANDYRVPPGFSLTTAAYDPAYSPGMPLPAVIETEGAAAYGALSRDVGGPDVPVAGRSSAPDGDGELAAVAGPHRKGR